MRGSELVAWRKRLGYSQIDLMRELEVRSRQTISSWENSERIPRIVELAIVSLERDEQLRRYAGKAASAKEVRHYFHERKASQ